MAVVNKDYRIKHGLIVEGTNATVDGYDVLKKSPTDDQYIIDLIGGDSGFIQTGDDASLNTLQLTSNADGINIKVGDDAWIGDVNLSNTINILGVEDQNSGYISFGQNGSLIDDTAQKNNYIGSNGTDLSLGSSNDIILLPESGYAYIGTPQQDGSNRVAKISDIASNSPISSVDSNFYIDGSEQLHLANAIYNANGLRIGYQEGFDINFNGNNGDTYLNQTTGDGTVHVIGSFTVDYGSTDNPEYSAFEVDPAGAQTSVRNVLRVQTNNGYDAVYISGNEPTINLNNSDNDQRVLTVNTDYNNAQITAPNGDLKLSSSNNDVHISADGWIYLNQDVRMSDDLDVSNRLTVGGWNNNNGIIRAYDSNNNLKFYVDGDNNEVNLMDYSSLRFSNADGEQAKISIDNNLIIDGQQGVNINSWNNGITLWTDSGDIVLNPDGQAYINSNGSLANQIATRGYVDSVATGLDVKASVKTSTTGNINLLSLPKDGIDVVIDGVYIFQGDRVLVKSQDDSTENGIYIYDSGTDSLVRSEDGIVNDTLTKGSFTFVEGGTNAGRGYVFSVNIVANVPSYTWTQFSETGSFITSVGNYLDVTGGALTLSSNVVTTTGSQVLTNKTLDNVTLTNDIYFVDGNDNQTMLIEHSYTGTTRITANDDLALRSNGGDIILYPGNDSGPTGKAYIHWGDDNYNAFPEREIATVGRVDDSIINGNSTAEPQYLGIQYNWTKETSAYQWAQTDTQVTAISYPTNYASGKFIIRLRNGNHSQVSEVLLTLDNSNNVHITEYAIVTTNGILGDITASVTDGNVNILVTPTYNTGTDVVTHATLMAWGD